MQNKKDNKPVENRFKRPNRRPRREKEFDPISSKLVNINRVTKVVKGGRTMRFTALVVVGDKEGRVGIGTGKAAEVPMAIEKATAIAKKNMVKISLSQTTIPHEVVGKFGSSTVKLFPSKEGTGVIAGGSVRPVVELCGIKDVSAKAYGSRNSLNSVKATMDALIQLRSAEQVAELRGKTVEEIL